MWEFDPAITKIEEIVLCASLFRDRHFGENRIRHETEAYRCSTWGTLKNRLTVDIRIRYHIWVHLYPRKPQCNTTFPRCSILTPVFRGIVPLLILKGRKWYGHSINKYLHSCILVKLKYCKKGVKLIHQGQNNRVHLYYYTSYIHNETSYNHTSTEIAWTSIDIVRLGMRGMDCIRRSSKT